MEGQTVDFGIDLGTTNSVIARATPRRIEIVPNRMDNPLTPSAVACTARGRLLVGQDALNRRDSVPARWFKRLMGTATLTRMEDGRELTPEELSAEVLKELKAAVQLRYDYEPEHVVITVPAMFQQAQCEATRKATEMAGLKVATLLQEPIAAATAYLNEDPRPGEYLVYDLGGGTFDVSIIRLRDGEMSVLGHGGDNFLGGADLDRELFEWVLDQLRTHGTFPELRREPQRDQLLAACEDARKRLSHQNECLIDLGDLDLPVAQLSLNRQLLEDLICKHVDRTLMFTRERLEAANLALSALRGILLVGGPTKTPYVRQRLKELGVPLYLDQDPMTVVAHGAAIHASSILKPGRAAANAHAPTQATFELFYDPVSPDELTTVSGRVLTPEDFVGEVRLTRSSQDWDSGWILLRRGSFACEVQLRPGGVTEFEVSLRDATGTRLSVSPASVIIRHGIASAPAITPYNYGIALEDGTMAVIVPEKQPLPAAGLAVIAATRTIAAGSNDEILVYFLEGRSRMAEDNAIVGELAIRGEKLPRTLREGERIEVRIRMDESRLLKARVLIPVLDLDYEVSITSLIEQPPVQDLTESFQDSVALLDEIQDSVSEEDEGALRSCRSAVERIEAEVVQVRQGDSTVAVQAHAHLADLKATIRQLTLKYSLQSAYQRAIESIDRAETMAREFNVVLDIGMAQDLRADAERALRIQKEKELEAVRERAEVIFWRYYRRTRECWVELVEWLREHRTLAVNGTLYHDHLRRAEECLEREDWEGVRINGYAALDLLPQATARRSQFQKAHLRQA